MNNNITFLSPENINSFILSLSGMAADEVRKAKELYLRNAIADYQMEQKRFNMSLIPKILICIIPIFLPFMIYSIIYSYTGVKNSKQQILNIIVVWGDDLGDKKTEIENLLYENSYWG